MEKQPTYFHDHGFTLEEITDYKKLKSLPLINKRLKKETTHSFLSEVSQKWNHLFKDEDSYRLLFEHTFWEQGIPKCPNCHTSGEYYLINHGETGRHKLQRYKCKTCGKKFSVKTDTFMHRSKLSLQQWFWAVYYLIFTDFQITPTQLVKELYCSQKSAYYAVERFLHYFDSKTFLTNFLTCELGFDVESLLQSTPLEETPHESLTITCHHKTKEMTSTSFEIDLFTDFTVLTLSYMTIEGGTPHE